MAAPPLRKAVAMRGGNAYRLPCRVNKTIVRALARRPRGALTGRPMKRIDERELRDELVKLRAEHRELDDQIILLEDLATADQLLVKRLKKKKLAIKDRMTAIEDQLLPDIIA
jgi:hypothetical protein